MTFTSRRAVFTCILVAAVLVPAVALGASSYARSARPGVAEASPLRLAMKTIVAEREARLSLRDEVAAAKRTPAAAAPATANTVEAPVAPAEQEQAPSPEQAPSAGFTDLVALSSPSPALAAEPVRERSASVLDKNQMVVFYGTPLASGLGILGEMKPDDAARMVKVQAAIYDEINGERGAVGAMDVIYGLAQDEPTSNGLYVRYLSDQHVQRYLRLADKYAFQVILDLQIGRGRIPDEVRKIERYLLNPRVHVAIDPEYAVGPEGQPIQTPGRMSGHELNEVQDYIGGLIETHNLPPKMIIIHQFLDSTVVEGEATRKVENIDLVLNMDAFGATRDKAKKYHKYSSLPYAQRDSYNIFLKQDERVLSEEEVLDLAPMPDIVFYQ